MIEIKGKVNTAICYATVVEDEAIEQIRRMCEAVGLKVLRLKRVRVGNIVLGQLPLGQWRYIKPTEHF